MRIDKVQWQTIKILACVPTGTVILACSVVRRVVQSHRKEQHQDPRNQGQKEGSDQQ